VRQLAGKQPVSDMRNIHESAHVKVRRICGVVWDARARAFRVRVASSVDNLKGVVPSRIIWIHIYIETWVATQVPHALKVCRCFIVQVKKDASR
jgi:hypothetical protein